MQMNRRKLLAGAAGALASPLHSALAAALKPAVLVHTVGMTAAEAQNAYRLRADGTWLHTGFSPDISFSLWKSACQQMGLGIFGTEDGSMSLPYLMNDVLTSRLALRDSSGRFVSAPNGGGSPLMANIPAAQVGSNELFHFFEGPSHTVDPRTPALAEPLTDSLTYNFRAYQRRYVEAESGGGGSLVPHNLQPSWWERFKVLKLNGGDRLIRHGDPIALQSWLGLFQGGYFVSSDPGRGGQLVATSPSIGTAERFTVWYPCSFSVGSQIARVTHAFAYTEFSEYHLPPDPREPEKDRGLARDWTLSPAVINTVAARTGAPNVTVLTRSFVSLSEYPEKLPTHRDQVLKAADSPNCKGVVWEVTAGSGVVNQEFLNGVDAVFRRGKDCFIQAPPRRNCTDYTGDISRLVNELRRSPWYPRLKITLACYGRNETGVSFLGGRNSIEGALKWLLSNR